MNGDPRLQIPVDPAQLPQVTREGSGEHAALRGKEAQEAVGFASDKSAPVTHEEERLCKEIEKLGEEVRAQREANDTLRQDREQRKLYAGLIYKLVAAWLVGLLLVLCAAATRGFLTPFELSEKVLLLLVGGTTVNVFGLFYVVANYLFPKPK